MARLAGHVTCTGAMENAYKLSIGKPEGKISPVRCRHGWDDNIIIDLEVLRCKNVDWIHLAQKGFTGVLL